MRYFIFKKLFDYIWKNADEGDKKVKEKEIKPEGIIKKEYSIPLIKNEIIKYKSKELKFNIYYDEKIISRPVIIDIHGGGWRYGDKDLNDNFCFHLAKKGFNVVSLSYTLAYKAKLINQLQEIHYLINHLYKNNDKYSLDTSSLFLTGDSAGGELAFLYTAIIVNNFKYGEIFKIYNKNNIEIKGIVLNHATCYLKDLGEFPDHKILSSICRYGIKRMLYGPFFKYRKIYRKTDPNDIFPTSNPFPPILILTSKGDKLYSYQSILLNDDCNLYGIKHKFINLDNPKAIHVFNVLYPNLEDSIHFNNEICNFFKEEINKTTDIK